MSAPPPPPAGSTLEQLDAVVSEVDDDDDAVRRDADTGRPVELRQARPRRAELTEEVAVRLEHLDAVVARVGDDDVALLVDGDSLRAEELAGEGALGPEEARRLEVGVDDEQAVVVEVGDDDVPVGVEADAARRVKVLPHGAVEAVLVEEGAVASEQLHAVVTRVGDEDAAVAAHRHVPWVVELAVLRALLAELEEERAVEREHLHAVVVLVGDDDAALRVARDARRTVELAAARAGRTERVPELAVDPEHLHAVVAAVGDDDGAGGAVGADAPRATQLADPVALRPELQQGGADGGVVAPAAHAHRERAVAHLLAAQAHRHHVLALDLRPVADGVQPVLAVDDVGAVQRPVGALHHRLDGLPAHQQRLAVVVARVHGEDGDAAAQRPLQAVADRVAERRERPARHEAHARDGGEEGRVGRRELHVVVLVRLQVGAQVADGAHVGDDAVARRQHVDVAAALQRNAHPVDGRRQPQQPAPDLRHLKSERVALHLADLLDATQQLAFARLQRLAVPLRRCAHLRRRLLHPRVHPAAHRLRLRHAVLQRHDAGPRVHQQLARRRLRRRHRVLQVDEAVAGVLRHRALAADRGETRVAVEPQDFGFVVVAVTGRSLGCRLHRGARQPRRARRRPVQPHDVMIFG